MREIGEREREGRKRREVENFLLFEKRKEYLVGPVSFCFLSTFGEKWMRENENWIFCSKKSLMSKVCLI
jgi:hypothetical protein